MAENFCGTPAETPTGKALHYGVRTSDCVTPSDILVLPDWATGYILGVTHKS